MWQTIWAVFTMGGGLLLAYGGYALMGTLLAEPVNIPVGIMVGFIFFVMFEYLMQIISAPFNRAFRSTYEDISYFS